MPLAPCRLFSSPVEAEEALSAWLGSGEPWQEKLVVVPSRSLRRGLAARLCQKRPAWLGVRVLTLQALAYEVLQAAGGAVFARDGLLPVLVSRAAQELDGSQLAMVSSLEAVGPLVSTVRDLLDAGFTPAHGEACREVVEEADSGVVGRRGLAVLEVAARVVGQMEQAQVRRGSDLLSLAAEELSRGRRGLLRASRVVIYGFADVTALAGDFLQALVREVPCELFLVLPPDPVGEGGWAGAGFLARLMERFGLSLTQRPERRPEYPQAELWQAPSLEAEVRYAAEDILRYLEAGGRAEEIAVVARDLGPYRSLVRRVFTELGVPYSGESAMKGVHPALPLLQALLRLVAEGTAAPAELVPPLLRPSQLAAAQEVDEALRRCGARTLAQVPEGGSAPALLSQLKRTLEQLPQAGQATELGQTTVQLANLLALPPEVKRPVEEVVSQVASYAGCLTLTRHEWCFLVRRQAEEQLCVPLGGAGAGVAVLSAMEARFRSFRRIYLLGMVRDLFPQLGAEDPLLPEGLRQALAKVLPDIPLAARRAEEERYLFGLLLSSAQQLRISWPGWDQDGRQLARSPYVEELLAAGLSLPLRQLPQVWALSAATRRAHAADWVQAAGLAGQRDAWERLLARALTEVREDVAPWADVTQVAKARRQVLEEWDQGPGRREGLPSPYLGFLGTGHDLGSAGSYVTFWEAYARCPWQSFLAAVLRLRSPRGVGEEWTASLLGTVVHRVLARVVREGLGNLPPWWQRRCEGNRPVPWPKEEVVQAWCREEAEKSLQKAGIPRWQGLVEALAAAADPFLQVAREVVFEGGGAQFLAAEEEDEVDIAGERLRFRFDAVRWEGDQLVFLDYKTGRSVQLGGKEEQRLQHLRSGAGLQVAAYALAEKGKGYYVLLHPRWESERLVPVPFSDDLQAIFAQVLTLLRQAAAEGVFFPRLWDPESDQEPEACRSCEVRLACGRGESAVRRRLRLWGEEGNAGSKAHELLWLAAKKDRGSR